MYYEYTEIWPGISIFRIHDFDKNDKLDGLEVLKAVNHVMDEVRNAN